MYIILLLYLLFIIVNNKRLKGNKSFDNHYFILLMMTILMAGLSYRMGYDTIKYEDSFYSRYSDNLNDIWKEIDYNGFKEPGWVALNVICRSIFGDFLFLKLIIAAFVNSVIFWFFKKHLSNPGLGVLLYFLFAGWNVNFEILRASIAIAFFLLAFDHLLGSKPRYFLFYLWFLPALLFHWFAFIMLLTPLLLLIKPNIYFLLITIVAAFLTPMIISIGQSLNLDLINQMLGERIDAYLTSDQYGDSGLNIKGVLFSVLTTTAPFVYFCYFHKNDIDKRVVSITLVYALITILRIGLEILYRITDYYIFVIIILLPSIILKLKQSKTRAIDFICILLITVSIVVNLTSDIVWKRYVPYTTVINKEIIHDREAVYYELGYDDDFVLAR